MSNIKVPDTGPRNVDTAPIPQYDGTTNERQVIQVGDAYDLTRIRSMLEEMYVQYMSGNGAISLPPNRSASFDDQGNLDVSDGVSLSGGAKVFRLIALGTTNAITVKGSRGQVYGWYLFNAAAATRFVKLYNAIKTPNVGVDVPLLTLALPAGSAANVWFSAGIGDFNQGLGLATTVNAADSDATAVTAGDVIINLFYS